MDCVTGKELEDYTVLIFVVSKSKKSLLSKKSRCFLESEIFIKEQIILCSFRRKGKGSFTPSRQGVHHH